MKQWYALYVFLYSYESLIWSDCLVGHSCPGGMCPESGPLSLTCSITIVLGTLLMIDTYHICSQWYIIPSKFACKECFSIMLPQGEIPASGSMHPSRWLSPLTRKQNRTGVLVISWCRISTKLLSEPVHDYCKFKCWSYITVNYY